MLYFDIISIFLAKGGSYEDKIAPLPLSTKI
ncbi:MAG: hypothetical protein ACJAZX_000984 [Rickettsiales bacterium]|jgi:hypothetical protein